MDLSNELVVIFAAIGAVIFLFLMDYYYRTLESRAAEQRLEVEQVIGDVEQTIGDPLDSPEPALTAIPEPESEERPDIAA